MVIIISEFGIKIKNISAGTLYDVNLGTRDYFSYTEAMLNNSLFSAFLIKNGLNVYKGESTRDIICLDFDFGTRSYEDEHKRIEQLYKNSDGELKERLKYTLEKVENNKDLYDEKKREQIRDKFYNEGVDVTYKTKNKDGTIKSEETIHYEMLFRTSAKAKLGQVIFINSELYEVAYEWLTIGLGKLMTDDNAKIVEMSAYAPLTTSTIVGTKYIPVEDILILRDQDSFFKTMANIVRAEDYIDSKGRIGKKCVVDKKVTEVKNTLWDGMGLIEADYFKDCRNAYNPEWTVKINGMALMRHHLFKMCGFKSHICRKENVKIKPPSKVKKDIYNEIVKEAEKRNLTLLSTKDEFIKDKTYIHLYDGIYYYKSNVSSFLYGNTSAPFGKNNPYTIQNINIYLKNKKDCNVICLSNSYIDRNHELDFKCLDCGLEFKMAWHNAYRNDGWHNGIRCPSCGLHTESLHASILKQVFLHEYPDTVVEEKSCISTITGNILPTDIVNHSLKIAIEIQSQYHDKEYQKQKDEIKKSYWLSQNYHFYSPDIRDYTVLEMVQLFFPNILEILSCSGSQCRPVTTSISDFDCSIIVHFCKSRTYVFSCKSVVLQLTCERLTRRIMCDVTTYSTIYSPTRESLGSMMGRIV